MNILPTSTLFFTAFITLRFSLCSFFVLAHLSNTCLALMFFGTSKNLQPCALNPSSPLIKQTYPPLLLFSLPSLAITDPLRFLSLILGFAVSKGVQTCVCEHVCNTNGKHHTVQMVVLLLLWLPQLKVIRGRVYVKPSVCDTT